MRFQDIASDGSWVSMCQARRDTGGNGAISVNHGHHGETYGDRVQPSLIVGSGAGLGVDEILGHDPAGHWSPYGEARASI